MDPAGNAPAGDQASPQMAAAPVLSLRHAAKSFGAVRAVVDGSADLYPGEAHALLGENGAGKSTVVKMLAGVYQPDAGELVIDGRPVVLHSPAAARDAGLAVIYQEPTLFPDLTVAENIFMGRQPLRAGRRIDRRLMRGEAAALFGRLGVRLDPERICRGLSIADQQIVEIAKALSLDARVIGALLGNPVHYRDARTAGAAERVLALVTAQDMYQATGTQQLPFNTVYQLVAAAGTPQLDAARFLLLIPDLIGYWLTGEASAEVTNASTTGLLDVRSQSWATSLMARVGVRADLFPALHQPGCLLGEVRAEVREAAGLPRPLPVAAVGSHDTASAVVAVPADGPGFAYISCGTWSLAGIELGGPVLTEASREANFTNEAGIDGTIRYLRNVMGLWLLQESIRAWAGRGRPADLGVLLAEAARVPALRAVIDPDDPVFLPPGDMPARIGAACRGSGQPSPQTPGEVVRCILDSLALAHRRAVHQVRELSGRHVDTVHIVGGGTRNALLCQLTADACGLPVVAGPAEAAALGNVLVQARALGAGPGDLTGMRALVRATQPLRRYEPAGDAASWAAAAARVAASG